MAIVPYKGSVPSPYRPEYSQYFPVEYFSGVDVSLFFGTDYIDEIVGFEFTLTEQVVPVYGYASYVPERIVHGARLVSGGFTINTRPGDYLHELLSQYQSGTFNPNPAANANNPGSMTAAIGPFSQPDPSIDPDGWKVWAQNQKLLHWVDSNITEDYTENSEYFSYSGFTIMMALGEVDTVDMNRMTGRIRTIENVHIFSVGQQISLDGQNIQERFQFIASDINKASRIKMKARRQATSL